MAKRSKSQRLSSLLNVAGFIVDGYNGYKYHAKNKKLVYLSLGLSTVGTVLDFYISIKSPRKFKKAVAVVTLITNGARLFRFFIFYGGKVKLPAFFNTQKAQLPL
ncbi:hypothetical protein [Staphylococcus aureus]|uniref:hypothetical protein n=5 Tax=Staphylococcus aureus TaxID=1280 RepID=UPI002181E76D|nr:hypothetical protein [Staphylococcus aureus]